MIGTGFCLRRAIRDFCKGVQPLSDTAKRDENPDQLGFQAINSRIIV
jgi:hypothetical protein